jgi:protein-tyrosine kinase
MGLIDPMIVAHHQPLSPATEAYRGLRTNLQFMGLDKPLKSLVVTSAAPSEGKSTTAANLAVVFAQAGMQVCLVDADLRRPSVARLFGLAPWQGLTTAMLGETGVDAVFQSAGVERLTVLTSGPVPPNPAEILGSARMTALLQHLEARFDMVILDTPPVLAVTDATLLSPRVGGVLLVTRSGVTGGGQARRAADALRAVKANLLGSVLGAVREQENPDYQYAYYSGTGDSHPRRARGGWLAGLRSRLGWRRTRPQTVRSRAAEQGGTD